MSRIVVGIDGSDASQHALDVACSLARGTGAPVVAVSAWMLSLTPTT